MKKSLYSLMLMDSVVEEIDRIAHRQGTNRSNLINQILAQYAQVQTPEMRIESALSRMEGLLALSDLIVSRAGAHTLAAKSALAYKYRPTVKYEVDLYRTPSPELGVISVTFRTQSRALSEAILQFCAMWREAEGRCFLQSEYERRSMPYPIPVAHAQRLPRYAMEEGRFSRTFSLSREELPRLAEHLSAYVTLFDTQLKAFLAGEVDLRTLERALLAARAQGLLLD